MTAMIGQGYRVIQKFVDQGCRDTIVLTLGQEEDRLIL